MAHVEYTPEMARPARSARPLALRILSALGRGFVAMAEAGPRMEEVRRLNALSDADLTARGTTREAEVRRIFADRFYL